MIPKILHMIWLGSKPVPESMLENSRKWRKLMPDWNMVLWTDDDLPERIENLQLFESTKSLAGKSDILRLEILRMIGGVYVDGDVDPVKSLDPLLQHDCFVGLEQKNRINNAVIGAVPRHPSIEAAVINLPAYASLNAHRGTAHATGPFYLGRIFLRDDRVTKLPREAFYPYDWHEPWKKDWPVTDGTYGIHRWEASWLKELEPERKPFGNPSVPACHVVILGEDGLHDMHPLFRSIDNQSVSNVERFTTPFNDGRQFKRAMRRARDHGVPRVLFVGPDQVLDRHTVWHHCHLPQDVIGAGIVKFISSTRRFTPTGDTFPFAIYDANAISEPSAIFGSNRDLWYAFSISTRAYDIAGCDLWMPDDATPEFIAKQLHSAPSTQVVPVWTTWTYKLLNHPLNEKAENVIDCDGDTGYY